MAASDTDWEKSPSYYELAHGIQEFIVKTYHETFDKPREYSPIEDTWKYYNFTTNDILFVIILSIIWTILRHLATERIFKPIAHHYSLTPINQKKMPESAWKFVYYLCAWSYTLYIVVLSGHYKFFQNPSTVWKDWSLDATPPMSIYFLYMANCGFYLHSLYATLFLDTWRKDSLVMMIHHVLTLALISISYSLRYHNIGCLVLFFHDVCDILLEFTKLNVYFKIQGSNHFQKHEILANISFFLFTCTWFVTRLHWYPLKVLYSATTIVENLNMVLPCALLMNSLLWILQILNLYWFLFILKFLYLVATGQVQEVDDTREYDVEEKIKLGTKIHANGLQNGNAKANGSYDDTSMSNGDFAGIFRKRSKKE